MWYYANDDDQVGPVSGDELKALAEDGTIGPETQVWQDGMDDWQLASSVKGLLPSRPSARRQQYENGDDDYAANPYASISPRSGNRAYHRKDVSGKMTQLKVAGGFIIGMAAMTLMLHVIGHFAPKQGPGPQGPAQQAGEAVGLLVPSIIQLIALVGGVAMIRGKSYSSAIAAVVVSFIPLCGPCLGLSIPFAIWAVILLMDPDVKAAFG